MSQTLNILLVDDNLDLRDTTCELLEDLGHKVTVAARGDEALRLAEAAAERFDLLVSDFLMPGLNGVELTDGMLAIDASLPVVLVSSRSDEPTLVRRLRLGDVAFLSKPFALNTLIARIDEASQLVSRRLSKQDNAKESESIPELGSSTVAEIKPAVLQPAVSVGRKVRRLQLAAAAVLAIGAGWVWQSLEPGPPPLAPPIANDVTRSATIDSTSPRGLIAAMPTSFSWGTVAGATTYAMDLRQIDDTVLWRSEVDRPEVEISVALTEDLDRGVIYYWNVEAFDSAQNLIATSGPVLFSVDVAAESTRD